jgi:D-3-phosphoglycerate dehydrogenase / 2-oxoglutarate reductase
MKVLIADLFSAEGVKTLEEEKHEVLYDKNLSGDDLRDAMVTHCTEVLIVRSTKVTKEIIDSQTSLLLIIRAGAGYDTIDVAYATEKGIMVANCPGK